MTEKVRDPQEISFKESNNLKSLMAIEDLTGYYDSFKGSHIETNLDLYRNYFMDSSKRGSLLSLDKDEWRTNIKSPITHMFANNIFNMFVDGDHMFNVIVKRPDKYEDNRIAEDMMAWGDYLLTNTNSNMLDEVHSSAFDAMYLGTGTHAPHYFFKESMVKWLDRNNVLQQEPIIYDFPTARYVSPFMNFCIGGGISGSGRLHIERKLVPSQSIENFYKYYGVTIKKDEIKEKGAYMDTVDRESMKKNIPFYGVVGANDIRSDDSFSISNKLLECVEVTDGNVFSLWINKVYHGTHYTIGPWKEIPYIKTLFKKIPGMDYGLGVGFLCKPIQESFDILLNYRIDNVKMALNKMIIAEPGFNMFGNSERIRIKPGKIIKAPSINSLKEFAMSDVPQSAYTETDAMFSMLQGMTGISAPSMGMQSKVERVAGGPEMYKASADAQLNQFFRNYAKSMGKTMKFMMIYTLAKTDPARIDEVLGADNQLKNVSMSDLLHDFDFDFVVTNDKLDTAAVKRNQLLELIKTGTTPDPITGKPMFPQKLTVDLTKALLKTYKSLDIDIDSLDEVGMNQMANNTDALTEAVGGAVANQTPISSPVPPKIDMNQGMRDLQQQGAGGVPPEMTSNASGANQFTS